ncbi:GNAT family N-acetyltransferase [Primorskyibacter sp. S87]|uniref:GNAT family N-acetyltransferase n=1 Tax=Primorskyibacter sp. S87 TaxID=3415126 RepID=UPI003C7E9088
MIRSIPTINTARLTLAGMRPEDFERFAELWAMPEVVRHIGGEPRSRGRAWESFLRNAGHWQMAGFGQWGIVTQRDRRLVGQVGFFYENRDLGEEFDRFPEAGWALAPEAQGQGLGREAAQAAHDWFDRIITGPLVAMINAGNEASQRIADHLGYAPLREVEFRDQSVILLHRAGPPQG